jgi:hypothetical protein
MNNGESMGTNSTKETKHPDIIVYLGILFALSLLKTLTANRFVQAGGAVMIGVVGYLISPRPKINFPLYLALVFALAAFWSYGDMGWEMLRHMIWRY